MVRSRVAFCCSLASGLALFPGQAGAGGLLKSQASSSPKADKISFQKDVQPLLGRYCYGCHGEKKKGDLDLRVYTDERSTAGARRVFEKVLKNLPAHEMPPENKPQPTPAERDLITTWVASCFFPCDCAHPDPGRVTIRRLNRAEYNNTIRDLVGADLKQAADFPPPPPGARGPRPAPERVGPTRPRPSRFGERRERMHWRGWNVRARSSRTSPGAPLAGRGGTRELRGTVHPPHV